MERGIDKPYLLRKSMPVLLFSMAIFFSLKSAGQQDTTIAKPMASLHGRVYDSTQKKYCVSVAIALLQKDSTLLAFTRSQKDGAFYVGHLHAGRYLLLFAHPDYSEYSFPVILKGGANKDLGNIGLPPKSDLLTAVTVTPSTANPHFRGDTLEYNVGHLRMKPNASVEEMLRRLPGVQVDRYGNITVNGQRIERLLVDGEDFFSGDPSIVTRNFNADMINKVQVLDKKSKEAEFTGIDDGQKTKTLNLTLKEDSKKGYFANAAAGTDVQEHYSVNGMLGSFKNRRQFAALAMDANNDIRDFGDMAGQDRVGISIRASAADPLGASAGMGIPHIAAGTTHYANHWRKYDAHLSGDIQLGRLTTEPFSISTVIQTLPNGLYAQHKKAASINTQDQQGISTQYELRPDSLNALQISFEGSRVKANNSLTSTGKSSINDTMVNSTVRQIDSWVKDETFNASLMWNIRGHKRRQSGFSILANISNQDNSTEGRLFSIDSFYHPDGSLNYQDSVDQRKYIINKKMVLNSRVGYTESLGKAAKLGASYGISFNRSQSLQSTFGKGAGGYTDYIDTLSNHYENTIFSQSFGLTLSGNIRKIAYMANGGINSYTNTQKDLLKSSTLRQPYTNFTPALNFSYNINSTKRLSLEYRGETEQPSITQLQPVVNNNDPLHINIGNPDLHPCHTNFFEANFSRVGITSLYMGARYNFSVDAFGTRVTTDSLGRQITETVNVSGNRNVSVYMLVVNKIKKIDLDYSLSPFAYYTHNANYIGPLLDRSDGYKTGIDVGINKYVADRYSIGAHFIPIWYSNRSAINPDQRVQYWSFNSNAAVSLFFLKGCEFNMTENYAWQQKVNSLNGATAVLVWNASISRNLLNNRLNIRWQMNDILGQNKGIERNINSNTVSENTYNVLGRYWLLIASFRFVRHRAVK